MPVRIGDRCLVAVGVVAIAGDRVGAAAGRGIDNTGLGDRRQPAQGIVAVARLLAHGIDFIGFTAVGIVDGLRGGTVGGGHLHGAAITIVSRERGLPQSINAGNRSTGRIILRCPLPQSDRSSGWRLPNCHWRSYSSNAGSMIVCPGNPRIQHLIRSVPPPPTRGRLRSSGADRFSAPLFSRIPNNSVNRPSTRQKTYSANSATNATQFGSGQRGPPGWSEIFEDGRCGRLIRVTTGMGLHGWVGTGD